VAALPVQDVHGVLWRLVLRHQLLQRTFLHRRCDLVGKQPGDTKTGLRSTDRRVGSAGLLAAIESNGRGSEPTEVLRPD
jgi:hypothetical protein